VAVPQVELRIVDESDRALPSGEVGEICVAPATRGPYAHVYTPMLGYWRRAEATRNALRNGVYHTGDLGFLDADGCLYVRGRRSELILRGGSNVYPAEVERVLLEHADVAGAAVLGIPDRRLGERVVAAVQRRPAARVDENALREHLLARLARYKVPERIRFVVVLPRNAMQKVVKRELLTLFADAD
jgi:acyl-CoA synthetase (AMP-forming)/AMP-acid ligase II